MIENWVSIEEDPHIRESEFEEVLKELEVGKVEDIDDDTSGTRNDSDSDDDDDDDDDDDSSLEYNSHLDIEVALGKTVSFVKKKRYPKKVRDQIEKNTKEIIKTIRAHRQTIAKGSPSILAYFKPTSKTT
jgi:ABC-type Zn2+ transport system substrate-binding protein/surface adhesin